jgi:hypothetical protein
MFSEPAAIEMKTIKTNIIPQKIPIFKIMQYTRCLKRTYNSRFRNTLIILHPGEIYWGHIIMHKNLLYVDISECYKSKIHNGTKNIAINMYSSIYLPIIFDMSGTNMLNASECTDQPDFQVAHSYP